VLFGIGVVELLVFAHLAHAAAIPKHLEESKVRFTPFAAVMK